MREVTERVKAEGTRFARAGFLQILKNRPQHADGGPGYGMAIRAGQRSGKMQELIASLTSRCEELERERENLIVLCDQLKRDNERGEIALLSEASWGQQRRDERDEARQWANRRTRTAQRYKNAFERTSRTLGRFRAQLATAKNDALDEVLDILRKVHHFWDRLGYDELFGYINSHKDAGAYPADEISTGKVCGIEEV